MVRIVTANLQAISLVLIVAGGILPACHSDDDRGVTSNANSARGAAGFGSIAGGSNASSAGAGPASSKCFSPCRRSYTSADGVYHSCSADGLMQGCITGRICVDGTCLQSADASAPTCKSDVDCPDFQQCINGACKSQCESDSDCKENQGCQRKVCRDICSASKKTCPDGTYCAINDAENGFCVPMSAPTGVAAQSVDGTFALSSETLSFSNTSITQRVTVSNQSPRTREFVIKKVEQSSYTNDQLQVITKDPLPFLEIGTAGQVSKQNAAKVTINAGESAEFVVQIASGDASEVPSKWSGVVEVSNDELGSRRINLTYARGADGRWSGKVYYFTQFGERNLTAWIANRADTTATQSVGNAFIKKWADLRLGRISFDELNAVITSTINESWKWQSIQKDCTALAHERCYPNSTGLGVYSDDPNTTPIPAGLVELPMALDLKTTTTANQLVGRIPSRDVLHYAGFPPVQLSFVDDPAKCAIGNQNACLAFLGALDSTVVVGGRYAADASDTSCAKVSGFEPKKIPSLLQGFVSGTTLDEQTGNRYRSECRDRLEPFPSNSPYAVNNSSFAGSNPIPDGRSRIRTLSLVDGMLVNQDYLYVIFKENFKSFLGSDDAGFSSYGLMVLRRANAQLEASDFEATPQTDTRTPPEGILGSATSCSAALVKKVLGDGQSLTAATAPSLAMGVLEGQPEADVAPLAIAPDRMHYLCAETGQFDQGLSPKDQPQPCPATSQVQYFALKAATAPIELSSLPCQKDKTCSQVLSDWISSGAHEILEKPVWRCTNTNSAYCDDDRLNLLSGKTFYYPIAGAAVFVPLLSEIDAAFRYKTRFQNREGTNIGFAPEICTKSGDATPYCHDPSQIEEAASRVDCLAYIFSKHYADLSASAPTTRDKILAFLKTAYACDGCDKEPLPATTRDGFERLYAELMVMLGDESYTDALKSRFDLAESGLRAFEGSKFEPNGIDLSGVAGFEMYKLYQAAEYYQAVLDRFYSASPRIWEALKGGAARNYVTQRTVTMYFSKVLRASTQRARVWSEVGKRYQSFNQPDLARRVVERAYTSAYIESIVVSRMMQSLVSNPEAISEAERAQVVSQMDQAARTYRAALLDMREVYANFTDQITYFGYPPDYIPMPALEPGGANAFETILVQAKQSVQAAGAKEDIALSSNRSFDTDSAAFQRELATLRNNYENQLADICGTFTGDDGIVYPAISKYAHAKEGLKMFGDPCSLVGVGKIHDAMAELDQIRLNGQKIVAEYARMDGEIAIEQNRVQQQCGRIFKLADFRSKVNGEINNLESIINSSRADQSSLKHALDFELAGLDAMDCFTIAGTASGTNCIARGILATLKTAAIATVGDEMQQLEDEIAAASDRVNLLQAQKMEWETEFECGTIKVDSDAKTQTLALGYASLDIDALKVRYSASSALSAIESLRNQASRLAAEQAEAEQLAINLEVARNDPNVRIYKNDAVVNADKTFDGAIRDVYRATKVFEYYTSQSYAAKDELGLTRMVSRGDYNLENYLADLEGAYREFLESAGRPDQRVDILSLRDDILQIPLYDETGRALTQSERTSLLRAKLTEPSWLDAHGYRVYPFASTLARLSPLTRNHKISHIEVEIIGSNVGDTVGRVYVAQNGTAQVHALDDSKTYYRFPARTSVVNPFFNGVKVFDVDVYRNDRLRDRPYANSAWELILNQRDETVNNDIDLNSLTDIRLFVYYNDFTEL